ncbi:hypothetical protein LTS14_006116 [Recurvomyces mirabilis]|uniref:uncharacterized protein n=1 Tax=Recurvomyces mirabilis TaxID=574656 RepID=UPI002DDFD36A|nr:hypothetical protein LTS14_006116 [Recurvomyces mirabilis]
MATITSSVQPVTTTSALGLMCLPPELRNMIYELVLIPIGPKAKVNLEDADPPTKGLLLVSKQMHAETHATYNRIYCGYCRNTNFVIELCSVTGAFVKAGLELETVDNLRDRDLTNIRLCEVLFPGEVQLRAIHSHGKWFRTDRRVAHNSLQPRPLPLLSCT